MARLRVIAERPSRAEWRALAAISALGAVLRVVGLSSQDLWSDEAYSVALAQRPFGEMIELFGFEANGMLYWLTLWPLTRISEATEVVRLPALFAGILAVPALWWAARGLLGSRVGVVAAALLAVNPYAIWFAQEARPYSFVVLFSALSFGLLHRALISSEFRTWALYAAVMGCAAYSNALAAPLLVLAQLPLVVLAGGRPRLRPFVLSLAAVLLATAPLLVALAIERSRRDTLYFLYTPGLRDLALAARDFVTNNTTIRPLIALGLAATVVTVVFAAIRIRRRGLPGPGGLPALAVVAAWVVLPVAILFIGSQFESAFESHNLMPALPGAMVLLAAALVAMPRVAAALCGAALLVAMLGATAWQTTVEVKQRWSEAADHLRAEARPEDPVVLQSSFTLPALAYHYEPLRTRGGDLPVSEWGDRPLPGGLTAYRDPGGYGDDPVGPPSQALVSRLARGGRAVVVLAQEGSTDYGPVLRWAKSACSFRERRWSLERREDMDVYVAVITDCATGAQRSRAEPSS